MKQLKLFSSEWCGPCKLLKSKINELDLKVDIIDVDSNTDLVKTFNVRSIPTLVVEDKANKECYHVRGADDIINIIKEYNKELL